MLKVKAANKSHQFHYFLKFNGFVIINSVTLTAGKHLLDISNIRDDISYVSPVTLPIFKLARITQRK